MRADHDLFQRTVILIATVVLALGYRTLNAAICIVMVVHVIPSFFNDQR